MPRRTGKRSKKLPPIRSLLLQVIVFQGSALVLDRLPKDEVRHAIVHVVGGKQKQMEALRLLFEAALDLRPNDMLHYRPNHQLRALFAH